MSNEFLEGKEWRKNGVTEKAGMSLQDVQMRSNTTKSGNEKQSVYGVVNIGRDILAILVHGC